MDEQAEENKNDAVSSRANALRRLALATMLVVTLGLYLGSVVASFVN